MLPRHHFSQVAGAIESYGKRKIVLADEESKFVYGVTEQGVVSRQKLRGRIKIRLVRGADNDCGI